MTNDRETLFDQLVQRAVANGRRDLPALQTGDDVVTYDGLARLVDSCAEKFAAQGLAHGERVLLVLPNSIEFVVAVLSVTSLGAIVVPVIADAGPERLAYAVENTTPIFCIVEEGTDRPPISRSVSMRIDWQTLEIGFNSRTQEVSAMKSSLPKASAEDVAIVLFSSGTTGRPKGVSLKHKQLLATTHALTKVFQIDENHRELIICPMCHSGGWQRVAATLRAGGCVVLPQGLLSVTQILEDIQQYGVTGFFSPPPLLRYMLLASREKVVAMAASLRSIEIGSASLKEAELRNLMNLFPSARVYYHYGMTECSRAFILDATAHPDKLHTVGKASPGINATICDEQGEILSAKNTGQIRLRGDRKTDGYWNRPDLDKQCFDDGWLLTGDYGQMDDDGYLTVLGRKDDMISSAGFHFFPAEIEMELGPVDDIVQYLVAGVADPRGILGEVPWAFVVPKNPDAFSPREFLSAARKRLSSQLIPRNVISVPSLPLTSSGKPDRRRTLELYASPAK